MDFIVYLLYNIDMNLLNSFYTNWLKKSTILWVVGGFLLCVVPVAVSARVPDDQWYILQDRVWNQIQAPQAWNYETGNGQVVVAVIDTGVDISNPELSQNIWLNEDEVADNGIDDDNNGYVDDLHGWNFVGKDNNIVPPAFAEKLEEGAAQHGTLISGLIGAIGNNKSLGTGLNWRVKIMPLRVMDNNGSGSYGNITAAVEYAIKNKANVISISIVGEVLEEEMRSVMRRAYDAGIVIVAAAGNSPKLVSGSIDTNPVYPVCFDKDSSDNWLIGVTSVDRSDSLSSFASCGPCVDIMAPGENIYSTELYAPSAGLSGQFGGPWSGTSFSVPLVAGSAALLKSIRPEWSAKEIILALLNSADVVDEKNPDFVGQIGYGRLNIGRAAENAYLSKPVDLDIFNLYSFNNKKIYFYQPQLFKNVYLTSLDWSVINMAYGDLNNDGIQEIATMTKNKNNYQINIVSSKGNIIFQYNIKLSKLGSNFTGLNIYSQNNNQFLIVSEYDNKTNKTKFLKLNWRSGEKITEVSLLGRFVSWSLKKTEEKIVALQQTNSSLRLLEYDWNANKIVDWRLTGVSGVPALAVGKVWSGDTEQAVITVNRGKNSEMYVYDLSNSSFIRESFGLAEKYKQNIILKDINFDGLSEILHFQSGGGNFSVIDGKGKWLQSLRIDKISGQLAD